MAKKKIVLSPSKKEEIKEIGKINYFLSERGLRNREKKIDITAKLANKECSKDFKTDVKRRVCKSGVKEIKELRLKQLKK